MKNLLKMFKTAKQMCGLLGKYIVKPFFSKISFHFGFSDFEVFDNYWCDYVLINRFEHLLLLLRIFEHFLLIKPQFLPGLIPFLDEFVVPDAVQNRHVYVRDFDHSLICALVFHFLIDVLENLILRKSEFKEGISLLFLSIFLACQKFRFSTSFLSIY